ncbi:hypothetical protein F2Q69_00023823 [Brassica cretica]|uniref:Uncharacterized protein n=1 Tax=Brassica cretica TaxID=69181 RepID=A0A8S9QF78_BRACR|nr:hypothetical protein F2Q69_00023823 [Brassica cretica]
MQNKKNAEHIQIDMVHFTRSTKVDFIQIDRSRIIDRLIPCPGVHKWERFGSTRSFSAFSLWNPLLAASLHSVSLLSSAPSPSVDLVGDLSYHLSLLNSSLQSWKLSLTQHEGTLFLVLTSNSKHWRCVNGRVYKLAFCPKAFVVISDPIVARHVLRENAFSYDKGVLSEILEPIMGNLLTRQNYILVEEQLSFSLTVNTIKQIMVLGFDDKFIRTWNYYFDYCAAGFKTLTLGNYQGTVIMHATREEEQASSGTLRWHESGKSFKEEHLVSLYSPEY